VFVGNLHRRASRPGPIAAIALLLLDVKMAPATAIIHAGGILWPDVRGSTIPFWSNIRARRLPWLPVSMLQMARQGRAGPALGIALWAPSLRNFRTRGLMFFAPFSRSRAALRAAGIFCADVFGLTLISISPRALDAQSAPHGYPSDFARHIGNGSDLRARALYVRRLLWEMVWDCTRRLGVFGIAEVWTTWEKNLRGTYMRRPSRGRCPAERTGKSFWPIVRGSIVGFFIGILPDRSKRYVSFASYAMEKRLSRHPEKSAAALSRRSPDRISQ